MRTSVNELTCVCFTDIEPRFVGGGGYGYDHMQMEADMADDYTQAYDSVPRGYTDAC